MTIERVGTYRVVCGNCSSSYRVIKGEDDTMPNCYVCGHGLTDEHVIMIEWGNEPVDHAVTENRKKRVAR